MKTNKTGLVITTYNSSNWFGQLHSTIPFSNIDESVVVNGGDPYKGIYFGVDTWMQHNRNVGACQSRIDGIKHLLGRGCEHIFIVEDDMIIKDNDIFSRYIETSKNTGLKYLCFCSNAMGSGEPFNRTPKATIDYGNEKACFYGEMNNEFTYHHRSVFEELGVYDPTYKHLWDVEFVYRVMTSEKFGCGFRYFPDIFESDKYIMNNPESINNSRTNANHKRDMELPEYFQKFQSQHGHHIARIPVLPMDEFKYKLKVLYANR